MNEYYYYVIICRYIDRRDRVICSRRDRHLIVLTKRDVNSQYNYIYVHIE